MGGVGGGSKVEEGVELFVSFLPTHLNQAEQNPLPPYSMDETPAERRRLRGGQEDGSL